MEELFWGCYYKLPQVFRAKFNRVYFKKKVGKVYFVNGKPIYRGNVSIGNYTETGNDCELENCRIGK